MSECALRLAISVRESWIAHPLLPQSIVLEEPVGGTGYGHNAIGYKGGLVTEMLKGARYETIPSIRGFIVRPYDRPICKDPRRIGNSAICYRKL